MLSESDSSNVAFESMFDHARIGIVITNERGIIEKVNPFLNKTFGFEGTELVGQLIEVLIPQEIRTRHVSHRELYNKNPYPREMGKGLSLAALHKNGTTFPVEISLTHYSVNGKNQIVGFVTDITERKIAEDKLKALNEQLESAVAERTQELSQAILELQHINQQLQLAQEESSRALDRERELGELKTRFVSMASHEFRTPLGGIMSSAELIARYQDESNAHKRLKHVNTIKESVRYLTSILNDFLSLDKLDADKMSCHVQQFDLCDFLHELIAELRGITKENMEIHFNHHGGSLPVFLDKTLLRNIVTNLVSNAIKYSVSGKKSVIGVTSQLSESSVVISVVDNGMGIPDSDQKHLFERFFRATNAATVQGTGLGLNIVKRYLDLMNGTISFTSKEGLGTTFDVVLPRQQDI